MTNLLLTLAFLAMFFGVFSGQRTGARTVAKGPKLAKVAVLTVVFGFTAYLTDHFASDIYGPAIQMTQSLEIVSQHAAVFAGMSLVALFTSFATGWCMGYVSALYNGRSASSSNTGGQG